MSLLIDALRKRQQQTTASDQVKPMGVAVQPKRFSRGWLLVLLLLAMVILLIIISMKFVSKKPVVSHLIERRQQAESVADQPELKERVARRRAVKPVAPDPAPVVEEVISEEPVQEEPAPVVETEKMPEPEPEAAPPVEKPVEVVATMSIQDASMHTEYEQAKSMIDRLDYEGAIQLLNNKRLAIQTQGNSAVLLGSLYLQLNRLDQARDYLSEAMTYHTAAQIKLVSLLGETYFRQGDYRSAIALLNQASPSLSEYPSYYTLLARSYLNVGEPQAALEILQQVVAIYPSNGSYWVALGLAYQKAGDHDSAVVAYNKAAELNDDNPQALLFINQQLRFLQS